MMLLAFLLLQREDNLSVLLAPRLPHKKLLMKVAACGIFRSHADWLRLWHRRTCEEKFSRHSKKASQETTPL